MLKMQTISWKILETKELASHGQCLRTASIQMRPRMLKDSGFEIIHIYTTKMEFQIYYYYEEIDEVETTLN